jgi:hypothetical protein
MKRVQPSSHTADVQFKRLVKLIGMNVCMRKKMVYITAQTAAVVRLSGLFLVLVKESEFN